MSESRIKNAFSRSTILTVGRLLVFIAAGFAVGLAIGVVTEEPELLAGHLRGDSETVELDEALLAKAEAIAASERTAAGGGAVTGEERWAGSGDSDEIEVPSEMESTTGLPPVGAAPDGFAHVSPGARSPAATPKAPGAAVAVPAGGDGWAIQVGAFGDEPSAAHLADRLEGKGYPVEVLPAGAESNRWRVRVQPIAEEKSARATAERIEREERLPTWVIRLEGQTRS